MNTGTTAETARPATVGADLIRAIGQVVAAIAAGVGVIYAVGGLIIWLRLLLVSKPQLAVVSELPREVVSALGLVVVVLALGVGAIYALWRLVWQPESEAPSRSHGSVWRTLTNAWRRVLVLGICLAAPTAVILLVSRIRQDEILGMRNPWGLLLAVAGVWFAMSIWALVSIRLWDKLGEAYWVSAEKTAVLEEDELEAARRKADRTREAAKRARTAARDAGKAAREADKDAQRAREDEYGGDNNTIPPRRMTNSNAPGTQKNMLTERKNVLRSPSGRRVGWKRIFETLRAASRTNQKIVAGGWR